MDSKGFRIKGEPDLVLQPSWYQVRQETTRETEATKTVPVNDARYNAFAAPMSDGRLVTDYRPSCVTRAPPGSQHAVKQWTIHNAESIMEISRARQAQSTGQALGTVNTEMPPSQLQHCSVESCDIYSSGKLDGVGIERTDPSPTLFGTFQYGPDASTLQKNTTKLGLNTQIAYGRNTPSRWSHVYA